jgi:transcriptional regulator with XRE-family HTH domain
MDVAPDQIRAARALLRLEQAELAQRAQVSVVTIRRVEAADASLRVAPATIAGIRQALEAAGAEFIPGGVRRRLAGHTNCSRYEDLRAISLASAARLRDADLLSDMALYDDNGLPG